MAFTTTQVVNTVHGNQRVWQGTVTADNTSGAVSFGFSTLTQIHWSPSSSTTNNSGVLPRFRINLGPGGTAAVGTLGISGVVSGDEYYVTVYGR